MDTSPSHVTTIEDLPNHLLLHLLSFVDTKTAVRMALMSKQWKELWFSFPFFHYEMLSADPEIVQREVIFMQDYFRHRTDLVVQDFDITLNPATPQSFVFECLRNADSNKAKNLRIATSNEEFDYPIRPLCFTNPGFPFVQLRSLVLACRRYSNTQLPGSWRLPGLRHLKLNGFHLNDESLTCKIFEECPKLEKLSLNECCIGNVKDVIIQFPELKTLKITQWLTPIYGTHRILVLAPKLKEMYYTGPPTNVLIEEENVNCLNTVNIGLRYRGKACFRNNTNNQIRVVDFKKKAGKGGLQMIRQLHDAINHMRCLSLSSDTVEALLAVPSVLENNGCRFHKLEKIRIYGEYELTRDVNDVQKMLMKMAPQAHLIFDTATR